ncbi:hypothetical protein LX32DRAFT_634567 [Colletotrichum zoysiae]|uniref:Secreted protein n=1 Tax=Colletotrichum zoysiae TaxID=1216348 RepID=A0AAD9HTR5_9PEZI|nr:hypothetical protein LX32DRAFT_634567 [Colletotrichum zoysiae]
MFVPHFPSLGISITLATGLGQVCLRAPVPPRVSAWCSRVPLPVLFHCSSAVRPDESRPQPRRPTLHHGRRTGARTEDVQDDICNAGLCLLTGGFVEQPHGWMGSCHICTPAFPHAFGCCAQMLEGSPSHPD